MLYAFTYVQFPRIFGRPNITGSIYVAQTVTPNYVIEAKGAFKQSVVTGSRATEGVNGAGDVAYIFSANDSNVIYANSDTVQPKTVRATCLIRYM